MCASDCCPVSATWCWMRSTRETCSRTFCSPLWRTYLTSEVTSRSSSWVPLSTQRSFQSISVRKWRTKDRRVAQLLHLNWLGSSFLFIYTLYSPQTTVQWSTSQVWHSQWKSSYSRTSWRWPGRGRLLPNSHKPLTWTDTNTRTVTEPQSPFIWTRSSLKCLVCVLQVLSPE